MNEDEFELSFASGVPNVAQPTQAEQDFGKSQAEAYADFYGVPLNKIVVKRDGIIIYDGRET